MSSEVIYSWFTAHTSILQKYDIATSLNHLAINVTTTYKNLSRLIKVLSLWLLQFLISIKLKWSYELNSQSIAALKGNPKLVQDETFDSGLTVYCPNKTLGLFTSSTSRSVILLGSEFCTVVCLQCLSRWRGPQGLEFKRESWLPFGVPVPTLHRRTIRNKILFKNGTVQV